MIKWTSFDGYVAVVAFVVACGVYVWTFFDLLTEPREFLGGYDDPGNFEQNPYLNDCSLSIDNIRSILEQGVVLGVYEPVSLVFRLIAGECGGSADVARRVVRINVGLHFLNSTLAGLIVFWYLKETFRSARLSSSIIVSTVSALFFAVHPLRTEAVAWASCQSYLLAGLFSQLAIAAYRWRMWTIVVLVALALAVFSKAIALSVPAVFVAVEVRDVLARTPSVGVVEAATFVIRRRMRPFACFVATAASLIVRQTHVTDASAVSRDSLLFEVLRKIMKGGYAACFYLVKSLEPRDLSLRYPPPTEEDEMWRVLRWPFVIACALTLLLSYRKDAWLAWATYAALLSPTFLSNHCGMLAADRYSYVPALVLGTPICAMLALRVARRCNGRSAVVGVVGTVMLFAMTILLGSRTRKYAALWSSEESLWQRWVAINPQDAGMHMNLGVYYFEHSRFADAAASLKVSRLLVPQNVNLHVQYVSALVLLGRSIEALRAVEASIIALAPVVAVGDLAGLKQSLLHGMSRFEDARAVFASYEDVLETRADALSLDCDSLRRIGRYVDAEVQCRRAASVSPDDAVVVKATATLFREQVEAQGTDRVPFASSSRRPRVELTSIARTVLYAQATILHRYDSVSTTNNRRIFRKPRDRRRRRRVPSYVGRSRIDEARRAMIRAYELAVREGDVVAMADFAVHFRGVNASDRATAALEHAIEHGCTISNEATAKPVAKSRREGPSIIIDRDSGSSSSVKCYGRLAHALGEHGRYAEAAEHYEEASRRAEDARDAAHHSFNAGCMYGEMRRWDDAEARFERALILGPDLYAAHCYLGEVAYGRLRSIEGVTKAEATRSRGLGHIRRCLERATSEESQRYRPFLSALLAIKVE